MKHFDRPRGQGVSRGQATLDSRAICPAEFICSAIMRDKPRTCIFIGNPNHITQGSIRHQQTLFCLTATSQSVTLKNRSPGCSEEKRWIRKEEMGIISHDLAVFAYSYSLWPPRDQVRSDFPDSFSLSHSRRALFIRVYHPLPVALNASDTSLSRRMLKWVLVSAALGRPRDFNMPAATFGPKSSGSSSAAGRACWKSSSVHSGFLFVDQLRIGFGFHIEAPLYYWPCEG